MTSPLRTVWTVFEARSCPPEQVDDPEAGEIFVPADSQCFETRSEAFEHARSLLEDERWEVGVLVDTAEPPLPWKVSVLEPASFLEKQQVRDGELEGFRWDRARPPRREPDRAVFEVQELWRDHEGRRAFAVEQELLEPKDLTRITLGFRERRIF